MIRCAAQKIVIGEREPGKEGGNETHSTSERTDTNTVRCYSFPHMQGHGRMITARFPEPHYFTRTSAYSYRPHTLFIMNLPKLQMALWILSGILVLHTFVYLAVLLVAVVRRLRWHRELQSLRKGPNMQRSERKIGSGTEMLSATALKFDRSVKGNFGGPQVGWKAAYAAAQDGRTGLRELFI